MRALMLSPELLLLDEPLGALDPLVRASLQKDLKEIFTRLGQTVLFVTHDLGEAIYFADQIVLMNEGRIVQKGTITDLRESQPTLSCPSSSMRSAGSLVYESNQESRKTGKVRIWKPESRKSKQFQRFLFLASRSSPDLFLCSCFPD